MLTVPVFPLRTVLFPGSRLPLQIFEPRYLDMIRECSRDQTPFAVCLLINGSGEDANQTISAFGCLAGIVDFCTLDNGLLGITALGGRRVRLTATRVRDNGLIVADVERLPEEKGPEPGPEHSVLTTILRSLLEQALDDAADNSEDIPSSTAAIGPEGGTLEQFTSIDEAAMRDSAWVSYRLADLLPIDLEQRQQLLEVSDPRERLNLLNEFVSVLKLTGDEGE